MKNNSIFCHFSLITLLMLGCSALNAAQYLQLVENRTLPLQPPPPLQPSAPLKPNPPITPQPFKPSTPATNSQQPTNNNQNTNQSKIDEENREIMNNNQPVIYYNNPPYYYNEVSPTNTYLTSPSNNTVINQGTWVQASDGAIPDKAISYVNKSGLIAYHCRALYRDQMYYGEIVAGKYCVYRDDTTTLELKTYEVQVEN